MKDLNLLGRVMMIAAYGAVEMAVGAMKLGADDFLEKPVRLAGLLPKVLRIKLDIQAMCASWNTSSGAASSRRETSACGQPIFRTTAVRHAALIGAAGLGQSGFSRWRLS